MTETNGKLENNPRFDHRVRQYIALRDKIAAEEAKFEALIKPVKEAKAKVDAALIEMLDNAGAEMVRTDAGTVTALVRRTASLQDPDAFMNYVKTNGLFELMDRRANVTACVEHAETHDGQLPPGVKLNSIRHVGVRK
jgi:hypothetical protein